jgi:hypothetical protein
MLTLAAASGGALGAPLSAARRWLPAQPASSAPQAIIARGWTRVGIRNVIKCRSVQEEGYADDN